LTRVKGATMRPRSLPEVISSLSAQAAAPSLVIVPTPMAGREAGVLLATVRELQRAADGAGLTAALRGKHLCLLGTTAEGSGAATFRDAARELGAQVTAIDLTRLALASDADVARCGRMLGQLYDGVGCEGLPSSLVDRLRACAGVPVYDRLTLDACVVARLTADLDLDGATPDEQWRRVLQAVLVLALRDA
jgi:hypothetical protein